MTATGWRFEMREAYSGRDPVWTFLTGPGRQAVRVCRDPAQCGDFGVDNSGRWAYICVTGQYSVFDLHAADVFGSRRLARVPTHYSNNFEQVDGDRLVTLYDGVSHYSDLIRPPTL